MAEQVPHLPTPYELAMDAAEGANIAHDVRERAMAARAAFEAAEGFGIDGGVIKPEAYAAVDGEIGQAQEDLDLFGRIVAAVMPPLEGVAEAPQAAEAAPGNTPPATTQQQSKATTRLTTQELINQKEWSRQRHRNILQEFLKRADDEGVYEDENMAEVIMSAVGATQPQWNRSITRLNEWGCITTELNEKTRKINKVDVDWDAIDVTIADGKVAPFPGGLTATEIMEAERALEQWDKTVDTDTEQAPELLATAPEAEPDSGDQPVEEAAGSPADNQEPGSGQAEASALIEKKIPAHKQYRNLLQYVLARVDSSGTYQDENLEAELGQELGLAPSKLRHALGQLSVWKCITDMQESDESITGFTVDTAMVDRYIAKQHIALFADEKTATNLLKSRQRELARAEDEEAAAAHTPAAPEASPPTPPAKPVHKLSAKVRRQIARDQANQGQAAPDPSELSEREQEIIELRQDAMSLTEDQHFLLEPLEHVALALLDETILAGSTREGLGKQLIAVTDLPDQTVVQMYGAIRSRNFLEFVDEGEVRKPQLTQAFRHYLRNIIQGAKENS